ncbi:hypothetical protein GL213_08860 [Halogeometricum borinquense]|uniref:Glycoside hydrolase domain protein n=2 Tax=Halogeometricum borinquense TaxID=60847 RepID=E4NMT6_HALBP|nr:hypothetical protein [Halogeometricum borinquense]ADQ67348.1 hypothetical protein Hbor_17800 [Halogeometricum borinquense DSM 11551]ELY28561.1 hypothetical protein C499_07860 [Halogeometricum borinquense DSM 11551]QIB74174.1 hypothetical protein G3I44_07610 [Halogeometricum borinquense]QIQ76619.1 hypothetical protein GL213_08860 [Halogeometricum borinquense]RYJ13646.1 hypothetical protein ELS19_06520 [Halogeometricum borinquense]
MYGVVTRNPDEVEWPDFDRAFYEVKDVTGRAAEPLPEAVNMVSCFGDTAAANSNPELVPVDGEGTLATRDQRYFDWAYICPTNEDYREGLLEIVTDCADENPDVRLDDVGFPRDGYCRCDRCERLFDEWVEENGVDGDEDDWYEWRAEIITEFVAEAADRIPGRTYLTLYPDPYPGHLYRRAGLDIEALAEYVDEFVVPLYDVHYGTTYWLETIAKGFQSLLDPVDVPFAIELYAVDAEMDLDDLIHATEVAESYAEHVCFGYDASNAAAALRRKRADQQEGVTHRPDDEDD